MEAKVELINYTQEPEKTVAAAARLCYSATGAGELMKEFTEEKVDHLLGIILENGHHSVLEHASFTFAIEGISRVCSHQLVRHRIASYSQQSQRYVREQDQFDYIIPEKIKAKPELAQLMEENMSQQQKKYDELTEKLMEAGYGEKEAIEAARYVFPNATETKIVVTMNARSLLHFFELRCCERAQREIRDLARKMLAQVEEVAPTIFTKAGPLCETESRCEEGDLSCGRLEEIANND
jgi:thymidylate synthase (FAD)